jgi:multidrug efflux system membrane fusion protein
MENPQHPNSRGATPENGAPPPARGNGSPPSEPGTYTVNESQVQSDPALVEISRAETGRSAPERGEAADVPTAHVYAAYDEPSSGGGRWWVYLIIALALAGAGFFVYHRVHAAAVAAKAKGAPHGGAATPVVAVEATRGDLPIYLNGLGTVTPFETIVIKTRIDGELTRIYFIEGQKVNEGDPIAEIDPRPFEVQLKQAMGTLERDQANLGIAQKNVARDVEAKEAISAQQLDTDQAAVAQNEGAVVADQSQIDSAKLNLQYCHITAPVTGVVGLRTVDEGNMVHATDTTGLATITEIQPITLIFTLPEDNIPQVLAKMQSDSHLKVEAQDRNFKHLANGYLLAIDNQVDLTSGTVRLKAVFENKDNRLYPNQFGNARLLINTLKNTVLVSKAAIQQNSGNKTFVYVVKPDSTVDMRNVTVGPTEGEVTAVLTGLKAGESVVTEGVDKLKQGDKIKLRKPGQGASTRAASGPSGQGDQGRTGDGDQDHATAPAQISSDPDADTERAADMKSNTRTAPDSAPANAGNADTGNADTGSADTGNGNTGNPDTSNAHTGAAPAATPQSESLPPLRRAPGSNTLHSAPTSSKVPQE